MTVQTGTTLGHYKIVSSIGAGGMGEVFRATDMRLNRSVAVKILPPAFAADEDRLRRFEQEAKATSALNHPNILTVYDIGEHDGSPFIVAEMLDGEELRDRLEQGPIPVRKVIDYSQQIISGLSAAHEKGIVHRDLKPENIFITKDDRVKILDFGLAKLRDREANKTGSEDETRRALTDPDVVMGTAGYMSPEQVRGAAVDHRSDIFSFGVILYEMLSGKRAFSGDSVVELMHSILKDDPADLVDSEQRVPPALERLMRRCLEKKPEHRFHSAHDLGFALEAMTVSTSSAASRTALAMEAPASSSFARIRASGWKIAFALASILAIALAAALIRQIGSASTGPPLRRFALTIPAESAPNWNDFDVTISPDGSRIAYNCREGNAVSICVRDLANLSVHRVAEGRDAYEWFFSPDGEWIGVGDEVGLSKVSIRGGNPQVICRWPDTDDSATGFSWGTDGDIVFGTASGIRRVSSAGGVPVEVTRIDPTSGVTGHILPSHVPETDYVLITIDRTDDGETGGLVNLKDRSVRDLGIRGHGFRFVSPGWVAFRQGTTLHAFAFDPADPTRTSNPVPVLQNVVNVPTTARDGTLVYTPTRGESRARLVWVDREGRPTAVESERLDYTHLDLGPDGQRGLLNLEGGKIDLIDLEHGTRKLAAQGAFPVWSTDGKRVTFAGRGGIQSAPVDGSSSPEILVQHPGFVVPTSWNAVTGELAYYDHRTFEIWIRSTDGTTRRFLGGPGRKRSGRFAPDGKRMAFVSDETGEYQVYVTAYPGPGPTVAISTKGGLSPIWSADGRELYFRLGSKMLMSRISGTEPLAFEAPVELFDGQYTLDLMGHQREDVAPDGRRFLMVENSDDFPIIIVQNWALELERLVK
jgi:serine/threonine protein kinase/Tol biopolymer transport system component